MRFQFTSRRAQQRKRIIIRPVSSYLLSNVECVFKKLTTRYRIRGYNVTDGEKMHCAFISISSNSKDEEKIRDYLILAYKSFVFSSLWCVESPPRKLFRWLSQRKKWLLYTASKIFCWAKQIFSCSMSRTLKINFWWLSTLSRVLQKGFKLIIIVQNFWLHF